MLRGVSLHLASNGLAVSVVARTERALRLLAEEAATTPGRIHPVVADYRNAAEFRRCLSAAIDERGPMTLAVCWIHSDAVEAPWVVADLVGREPPGCRYFDIVGTAAMRRAGRPGNPFVAYAHLSYRIVKLGFVVEGGRSRWLTHDEICQGVARAISQDAPVTQVGVVEPWSAHP